jgi:hypothetical protein
MVDRYSSLILLVPPQWKRVRQGVNVGVGPLHPSSRNTLGKPASFHVRRSRCTVLAARFSDGYDVVRGFGQGREGRNFIEFLTGREGAASARLWHLGRRRPDYGRWEDLAERPLPLRQREEV